MSQFFVTKVRDKGNITIVARIFLQSERLLNLVDIEPAAKEQVKAILYKCMEDILHVEDYKDQYTKLENEWITKWKEGTNRRIEPNAIHFEEIIGIKEIVKNFLIWSVISLRNLPKLLDPLFGVKVDSLQKAKKHFEDTLPKDHPFLKMLSEDTGWVKELYYLRGETEHGDLRIENVKLKYVGNKLEPVAPTMPNGGAIRHFLEVYLHNVFTFCEEFIVLSLEQKMNPIATVREIPENERDPSCPIRFMETLKPEYLPKCN